MANKKFYLVFGVKVDDAQLKALQKKMEGIEARSRRLGKNLQSVGKGILKYAAVPIAGFAALTLRAAGNFEAAMNQVAAKTGATGEDLTRLTEKARELGATTQFSASEAALAMVEFAKAGLSVDDILGTITASLGFASASQLDMASVATIAADAMAQFGLKAGDVGDIADTLTKAANSATTDVQQLAQALSFAGPIAGAAGVSLQETSTLLAALANNGVKSTRAGTALANTIGALRAPTNAAATALESLGLTPDMFVDSAGRMKMSVKESLMLLKRSGVSATQLNKIFEKETARSLAGLMNNLDAITDLEGKIGDRAGYASAQGKKAMEGFNGAIKALVSAFEALQISIGASGLLDFGTSIINKLADFFRWLSKLNPAIIRWGAYIGGAVISVGGLVTAIGSLAIAFAFLTKTLIATTAAGTPIAIAFGVILAKVALVVAAISAIATAIYLVYDDIVAFFDNRPSVFGKLIEWAVAAGTSIKEFFTGIWDSIFDGIDSVFSKLGTFSLGGASVAVQGVAEKAKNLSSTFSPLAPSEVDKQLPGGFLSGITPSVSNNNANTKQRVNVSPQVTVNVGSMSQGATPQDIGRAVGVEVARAARSAANSLQPAIAQ